MSKSIGIVPNDYDRVVYQNRINMFFGESVIVGVVTYLDMEYNSFGAYMVHDEIDDVVRRFCEIHSSIRTSPRIPYYTFVNYVSGGKI